ncbi:MAG: transposase [Pseudomonadota bacterium]|nr:transposase [Pseudomonadota bacterium]
MQIQRRGNANKPISDTQKEPNRRIAILRARVEHVFGAMRRMGGKLVRGKRIVRATFALHLNTASYNLHWLVFLKERGVQAF